MGSSARIKAEPGSGRNIDEVIHGTASGSGCESAKTKTKIKHEPARIVQKRKPQSITRPGQTTIPNTPAFLEFPEKPPHSHFPINTASAAFPLRSFPPISHPQFTVTSFLFRKLGSFPNFLLLTSSLFSLLSSLFSRLSSLYHTSHFKFPLLTTHHSPLTQLYIKLSWLDFNYGEKGCSLWRW